MSLHLDRDVLGQSYRDKTVELKTVEMIRPDFIETQEADPELALSYEVDLDACIFGLGGHYIDLAAEISHPLLQITALSRSLND